MSLDGISGYNYNGYLWELDPKKTTTTNSAFNTQKPTIPQTGYQTTPIGNMWGQPTSGIYTHSQYPTSLGQGSVFTQPTPLSNTAPAPAPIAAPVSNETVAATKKPYVAPSAKPISIINLDETVAATRKPYVAPSAKPISIITIDETMAATRKPYVAPSAKPMSIINIDETVAATQQPIEPASTAEARQKRVKTPEQRAAQLKRIRSNPEARARYKQLKLKNNPELASRYESYCKTVKSGGKLKALKKAGKWGALAALVIGGGTLLYKACSNDKKDDTVKQEPETPKPSVPAKDEQTKPVETTTPAEPVESDEIGIGEFKDGKYKVKKGDNFWRIAEKNLIEEYKKAQKAKNEAIDENYKPTDAEILKETERLVGTNGYEFDEKHWNTTKPIYEGDILNIAA